MADVRNKQPTKGAPSVAVRLSICASSSFNSNDHVGKPVYEEDLNVTTIADIHERVLDILNTDNSKVTIYFHVPAECDVRIDQRDLNNHYAKILTGQYVGFLMMHAHVDRISQPKSKLDTSKANPYSSYAPIGKLGRANPYHVDRGSQLGPYNFSSIGTFSTPKRRKRVHFDQSALEGFDDETAPPKASLTSFKASNDGVDGSRKSQPSYKVPEHPSIKLYRIGTKDTFYNLDKNGEYDYDAGVPCEPWLIAEVPAQTSGQGRCITLLAVKTWNFAGRQVGHCFLGEKLPNQMPTNWNLDPIFAAKHNLKSISQLLFDVADGKVTNVQVLASPPSGARLERNQIVRAPTCSRDAMSSETPVMQWANEEDVIFAVLCFRGEANNHDLGLKDDYQINLQYDSTCEWIEDVLLNGEPEPDDEDFEGLFKSEFLSQKLGGDFAINIWVLPNGQEHMYCWSAHKDWQARHWLDEAMIKRYGHRRLYIEARVHNTRPDKTRSKAIKKIDDEDETDDNDGSEIEATRITMNKRNSNVSLKGKGKGKALEKWMGGGTSPSNDFMDEAEEEEDIGDEIVVAQPKSKPASRKRTAYDSDEDENEEPGPPAKTPKKDYGSPCY